MATHSSIFPEKSLGQKSLAGHKESKGVTKSQTQLCTRNCAKFFTVFISFNPHSNSTEVGPIIISILQMRKLRF